MRKGKWSAVAVAAVCAAGVLVGGLVGGASASGATRSDASTAVAWQRAVASPPSLAPGCYRTAYPTVQWRPTPCVAAPAVPMVPATVGDGKDYSAVVTGRISAATGSFTDVDRGITEAGPYGGTTQIANVYSLQLNSQFFTTPVCSGSKDPAKCLGWEQFVYDSHAGYVFMQYWLVDYDASCPSGWMRYKVDCYRNSAATPFAGGRIPVSHLGDTDLSGTAVAGGRDEVTVSSDGQASMVSGADTVVDLAAAWDTAEFNVFGDGGGDQATFGAGTTLEPRISLRSSTPGAPSCKAEGFTAETNNLARTATPSLGSATSPSVGFLQVSSGASTPSCATAG